MRSEEVVDVAAEVGRITAALRTAIRLSRVSNRQIERELHMSTGYLTRILAGQVELRMRHVLGVCAVIGLPPGSFFSALFAAPPPESAAEARFTRGLASLHPEAERPKDPQTLIRELRACFVQLQAVLEGAEEAQP